MELFLKSLIQMHMLSNNECKSALQHVSFPSRDLVSLSLFLYVWLYMEVSRNLGQRLLILYKCSIYLRRHNFDNNNILKIIYLFSEHWCFSAFIPVCVSVSDTQELELQQTVVNFHVGTVN